MDYHDYLDVLEAWATERGYFVDFVEGGDDCICHISKIIEINCSNPYKVQLFRLLHECGHALIFDNGSHLNFKRFHEPSSEEHGSKTYRVFRVLEEAEAWKRGYKLAKRLNIPIDDDEWELEKVDALHNYIDWASDNS